MNCIYKLHLQTTYGSSAVYVPLHIYLLKLTETHTPIIQFLRMIAFKGNKLNDIFSFQWCKHSLSICSMNDLKYMGAMADTVVPPVRRLKQNEGSHAVQFSKTYCELEAKNHTRQLTLYQI